MPQRVYRVQPNSLGADGRPRGKGYQIVPSLDPNVSAVERALIDGGFKAYMPAEKRLIRDRRKIGVWTTRRFPLLPGYVFVRDVIDFRALEETPGVAAVLRNNGEPFAVAITDIWTLEAIEAESEAEAARQVERRNEAELAKRTRVTRNKARQLFPKNSHVEITEGPLAGRMAFIVGQDRDGRLKAIADGLDAIGTISVPVNSVRLVA